MSKRILLIGSIADRQYQYRILKNLGLAHCITAELDSETTTADTLRAKVVNKKVTHVVCVKTKYGSTAYWSYDLSSKLNGTCPEFYGLEIPAHPKKITHKGMERVKMIQCISKIFKNEKELVPRATEATAKVA